MALHGPRGHEFRSRITRLLPPVAFRRRRCLPFTFLAVGILFVLFTLRLPDTAIIWGKVEEIYGFLHVVTRQSGLDEGFNSPKIQTNPYTDNDISLYAGGKPVPNWRKEKARLDQEYPVVVFSKTYCPFSQKAKILLASYSIQPPPKIIEVDLRGDGMLIKQFLSRLTQHSTFPNIIIKGKTIGGFDDLYRLHQENHLRKILVDAGVMSEGS